MNYLTDKKLTIVGAAGMIGSNMAQTALMMKLTPNICLYEHLSQLKSHFSSSMYLLKRHRKAENMGVGGAGRQPTPKPDLA